MERMMIKSAALRALFFIMSAVSWLGIYLTGFDVVHWVMFIPAGLLGFAAITGICPGFLITNLIFPGKK